ncbi:Uncharacterised protein [Mycobacteroides abscessus subsp. abscessus]|nr:Uncharacterised protein [Mycobacteroides abscessus subsp. abscessus]
MTDTVPQRTQAKDGFDGDVRLEPVHRAGPGILEKPVHIGDSAAVDHGVDQHGGVDLLAQRMLADLRVESLTQHVREVMHHAPQGDLLIRGVTGQQIILEPELDVCHQRGQFR